MILKAVALQFLLFILVTTAGLTSQALILIDAAPTGDNKKAFFVIEKINTCLGQDIKKIKKCTSGLFATELSGEEQRLLMQWMLYPIQISPLKTCTPSELKSFKSPYKAQLTLCSRGKGLGEDSVVVFAFKKNGKSYQLQNIKP